LLGNVAAAAAAAADSRQEFALVLGFSPWFLINTKRS